MAATKSSIKHVREDPTRGSACTRQRTIGSKTSAQRAPQAGQPCLTPHRNWNRNIATAGAPRLEEHRHPFPVVLARTSSGSHHGIRMARRHAQIQPHSTLGKDAAMSNNAKVPNHVLFPSDMRVQHIGQHLPTLCEPRCEECTSVAATCVRDTQSTSVTIFWEPALSVSGRNCSAMPVYVDVVAEVEAFGIKVTSATLNSKGGWASLATEVHAS